MKVYVLTEKVWDEYYDDATDETYVLGVFSTREKAEAAKGVHHNRSIEEYELDNTDNV